MNLGAVQTVFVATGQEAVKGIIGILVIGWKMCLGGNPSCLSLVSAVPTPPTPMCECCCSKIQLKSSTRGVTGRATKPP